MRHRIFVDEITRPTVEVSGEEFHHAVRVVRARVGEEVELFDRAGRLARGTLSAVETGRAVVEVGDEIASREARLRIHLGMAIIQLEKFELVLQKATELGVHAITPVITERIELRKERYLGKMDRWQRIIAEAVKQSGRSRPPLLAEPAPFDQVVAGPGVRILFEAGIEPSPAHDRLDEVTLLIGPEGGWSDTEVAAARHHGCTLSLLGPRRLRAETAAIAATAIISARYGDI
jgi:16S rRNA (uracil1498-N3)-methyltransferase